MGPGKGIAGGGKTGCGFRTGIADRRRRGDRGFLRRPDRPHHPQGLASPPRHCLLNAGHDHRPHRLPDRLCRNLCRKRPVERLGGVRLGPPRSQGNLCAFDRDCRGRALSVFPDRHQFQPGTAARCIADRFRPVPDQFRRFQGQGRRTPCQCFRSIALSLDLAHPAVCHVADCRGAAVHDRPGFCQLGHQCPGRGERRQ